MRKTLAALGTALVLAPSAVMAQATGPDYTTLTSAVDFDSTITAVLAIGALAVGLALVTVGIRKILRMVRSA